MKKLLKIIKKILKNFKKLLFHVLNHGTQMWYMYPGSFKYKLSYDTYTPLVLPGVNWTTFYVMNLL